MISGPFLFPPPPVSRERPPVRPKSPPCLGADPARLQWPAELGLDQAVQSGGDALAAVRLVVDQHIADTTLEHLDDSTRDDLVTSVCIIDDGAIALQGRAGDRVDGSGSITNAIHGRGYHGHRQEANPPVCAM